MTVGLIYTGGTVGHRPSARLGEPETRDLKAFLTLLKRRLPDAYWPVAWQAEAVAVRMSEDRVPGDWSVLASEVDRQIRRGAAGVVLAHGTDTLIYTACALKALLRGVPVPVVLTGARRPLSHPRTDAVQNLAQAFRLAQEKDRPGIWIVFAGDEALNGLILDPDNARKTAGRPDCFQPAVGDPAGRVLGTVAGEDSLRVEWTRPAGRVPSAYRPRFCVRTDVVLFRLYPGFRPVWLREAARRGARVIVLEGYGEGTACTAPGRWDLSATVHEVVRQSVRVVLISQHGALPALVYGSTRRLIRAGAILGRHRTAEAELAFWMCRLDDRGRTRYKPAKGKERM